MVLQFNNQTKEAVLISSTESSVANEILKHTKATEKKPVRIDLKALQGQDIDELVQTAVVQNPTIFASSDSVVSGQVVETVYASIYELTIQSKNEKQTTVKITRDKTTSAVVVNNIRPAQERPSAPAVKTVTKSDIYGNLVTITNDKQVIR